MLYSMSRHVLVCASQSGMITCVVRVWNDSWYGTWHATGVVWGNGKESSVVCNGQCYGMVCHISYIVQCVMG